MEPSNGNNEEELLRLRKQLQELQQLLQGKEPPPAENPPSPVVTTTAVKVERRKKEVANKLTGQKRLQQFFTPMSLKKVKTTTEAMVGDQREIHEIFTRQSSSAYEETFLSFYLKATCILGQAGPGWNQAQLEGKRRIMDETLLSFSGALEKYKWNRVAYNQRRRYKLLHFDEDVRPAYYGTWRGKKSDIISARMFLRRDENILEYDVDSEAEWVAPEDGEELGSDEEEEEEEEEEAGEEEEDDWIDPDNQETTKTEKKVKVMVPVVIGVLRERIDPVLAQFRCIYPKIPPIETAPPPRILTL